MRDAIEKSLQSFTRQTNKHTHTHTRTHTHTHTHTPLEEEINEHTTRRTQVLSKENTTGVASKGLTSSVKRFLVRSLIVLDHPYLVSDDMYLETLPNPQLVSGDMYLESLFVTLDKGV